MSRGFILGLVLLACAAFLGLAIWQVRLLEQEALPNAPGSESLASSRGALTSSFTNKAPAGPRTFLNPHAASNPPAFQWTQVETEDYRAYLANLRKIGCPEQTVRDIITADLVQSYAPKRFQALTNRYAAFKYWSATPTDSAARSELERQRREIDEEMKWAMRELLGEDFVPPSTAQDWKMAELEQQLSGLTADKRNAVRNLLIQYNETDQQIRALASGQNLSENLADRARVIEAYDRKRVELQKLLSPEELQYVELSTSWTADNLRRGAVKFNPSPAEFQILFQEWQAYDEMLARLHASGQQDPGSLQEPMQTSLRQRLGEERAREFWDTWWR